MICREMASKLVYRFAASLLTGTTSPTRSERVIDAPLVKLVSKAEGYGQVQPTRVWTAISQVAGRTTQIHPKLRDGEVVPKNWTGM